MAASICKLCRQVLRVHFISGQATCPCWRELIVQPDETDKLDNART